MGGDVTHTVAGYEVALPDSWTDVEERAIESGSFLRALMRSDLTFSLLIYPGGGATAIDSYFKTALQGDEHGAWRGFDLERGSLNARGWELSTDLVFANFYGAEVEGDAVCWAWIATGPVGDADDVEEKCLEVIDHAIKSRG